ncbi:MAG: phage major capsid protein [Herbinix sp.]|nr:phage major capsid protein [Herbinix sp.]
MAITLAYLNETLQKDYLPGFKAQLNEESSYFFKLMEKNADPAMGADSTFLVTFGRSGGIGNRAENGDLPTASAAGRKQISVVPKNFYARIGLSDRLIKSGKTGAAFVNALDLEMEEIFRDSKDSLNRQLFGDGTGVMTTVKTAVTGTAFVVNSTKFLAPNQLIDIVDATDGTTLLKENVLITNVNKETDTVTVDVSVTVDVGDMIVTNGAYNLEVTGLDAIMTPDNTIYGLDRSTNSWFNPGVLTCSSSILLDEDMMEKAVQRVDLESGKEPEIILAGYTAFRVLKNYLSQFQRYSTIDTRYDAGHRTMSYDGIPVERDKYQGENIMDFLNIQDTFSLLSIGELFDWMNGDGAVLSRVANKAMYEAALTSYAEVMCKQPGANVRIKGIVA